MISETPYYSVCHEGGWAIVEQKNRPPYVISTWTKFEGKFRMKDEAKRYEKKLREDKRFAKDKIFVVFIDQRKALAEFDAEWAKPEHGKYRKNWK